MDGRARIQDDAGRDGQLKNLKANFYLRVAAKMKPCSRLLRQSGSRAGLADPQPSRVSSSWGPTGVGKTELASWQSSS